ncbi:AraC family transcriptional regulator [Nocardioides sp. CFH 31398]|uniref:AraC family transcriptional regulator n=1 Tax=Nocardioides sp. CFH 31398 TaxID=2919579 RepID=UPI001F06121E|nr:AraC family transcriptional regulator [Nocardioides sp. CFH 31398]MCH1866176.1 AraC family transcriptional regulator [Nocardioides sp. CFH 31398]
MRDKPLILGDMPVIRSAGLRGFRTVVETLGGDADDLARRAGLDPAALGTDEDLVDDVAVATALELAAGELGRPDLGLLVAEHQDLSMLGALALAVQSSATVADALECTSRYLFVHAPAMRISVVADPEGAAGVDGLRYDLTPPGVPPPPQGTTLSLGTLHRVIRSLVGGTYGLRTVDLPHPPVAPRSTYEEFFGARVRFDRPVALLRLPSSLRALPLAGRDDTVRRVALDYLARQVPAPGQDLTPRVRGAVRQLLGTTAPEVGVVSRLLDLHPRTLQRRLADEGTSFTAVTDDVRRQEARRYLTTTDLPLARVARLVGVADQAVLTRLARRWWGSTPAAVRRDARSSTGRSVASDG